MVSAPVNDKINRLSSKNMANMFYCLFKKYVNNWLLKCLHMHFIVKQNKKNMFWFCRLEVFLHTGWCKWEESVGSSPSNTLFCFTNAGSVWLVWLLWFCPGKVLMWSWRSLKTKQQPGWDTLRVNPLNSVAISFKPLQVSSQIKSNLIQKC